MMLGRVYHHFRARIGEVIKTEQCRARALESPGSPNTYNIAAVIRTFGDKKKHGGGGIAATVVNLRRKGRRRYYL